jgi:hypothetical protein
MAVQIQQQLQRRVVPDMAPELPMLTQRQVRQVNL